MNSHLNNLSPLLAAALEYAERGWPIFPCNPLNKRPLTKHGLKDASREPEQIIAWWTRWPNAMIAVATGSISGVVVLDVDIDTEKGIDGPGSLAGIPDAEIPAGAMAVRTPRGGTHHWFTAPEEPVRNSAGQLGIGIDVRGDGGYVIVPPSVNGAGIAYEWVWGALYPLPDWVRPKARAARQRTNSGGLLGERRREAYGETALKDECDHIAAALAGGRNHQLFKSACRLFELVAGGVLPETHVRDHLCHAARASGLDELEIDKTIASAFTHGSAHARGPTERSNGGARDSNTRYRPMERPPINGTWPRGNGRSDTAGAAPPEPYPLTEWNPWRKSGGPVFPFEALPSIAQDWVATRAMQTGADPSAFAMAFLHIISGCVDHRLRLQPKKNERGFLIGPNIWTMLVGRPSTLKTAVVRDVTRTLLRFDRQDSNARAESVRRAVDGGATKDDAEKDTPPARRRLLVDVTIEKIGDILSRQNSGATLARDELSGWLGSFDRYHKGSDRSFWLEAYNGGYFLFDRVTRETREIELLSVGIFGGIQPDKVKSLPDLTADGLFQRFAVLVMQKAGPESDHPIDETMLDQFERLAADIGGIPPLTVPFDEEADALYTAFSNEMRAVSDITAPTPAFGDFLGKQPRTVGAYALLLHIADISLTYHRSDRPISTSTFLRAQKIVEQFILPHAEMFYSSASNAGLDQTQMIAGALLKLAKDGIRDVTSRDLGQASRAIRNIYGDSVKLRDTLRPFIVNGWLTPGSMLPNNNVWVVNPALAGKFEGELRRQEKTIARLKLTIGKAREEDE